MKTSEYDAEYEKTAAIRFMDRRTDSIDIKQNKCYDMVIRD